MVSNEREPAAFVIQVRCCNNLSTTFSRFLPVLPFAHDSPQYYLIYSLSLKFTFA